jgi:exonuclease III
MEGGRLHIASWNVRGLCDTTRTAVVKNWVKSLGHPLHVLCLQEIKANDCRLDRALRSILPNHNYVVAPPEGTRGGTALLVHKDISVQHKGTFDFGQAAWAQLTVKEEDFGIVSVYAPSDSSRERTVLWHILSNQLPADRWIICGDFNMVELPTDTTGTASTIHGREQDSWIILKTRFELEDVREIAHTTTGAIFTRRGTHFDRFVQT